MHGISHILRTKPRPERENNGGLVLLPTALCPVSPCPVATSETWLSRKGKGFGNGSHCTGATLERAWQRGKAALSVPLEEHRPREGTVQRRDRRCLAGPSGESWGAGKLCSRCSGAVSPQQEPPGLTTCSFSGHISHWKPRTRLHPGQSASPGGRRGHVPVLSPLSLPIYLNPGHVFFSLYNIYFFTAASDPLCSGGGANQ